jgi:hypothetical protein
MKNISQVLEAPDLVRRVERLLVVLEELRMPRLRQAPEDLLRVLRRRVNWLRRHAVRIRDTTTRSRISTGRSDLGSYTG